MTIPTMFQYLPREHAEMICKIANLPEEENKEHPAKSLAKTVGIGALGMGAGTLAGGLAAHFVNKVHPLSPTTLMAVAPALGGGLGLAYTLWKAQEAEHVRHALKSPDDPNIRQPRS